MMFGPIGSPLDSSGWILAKYSLLSLKSSVYLIFSPVAFWKSSSVPPSP